MVIVQVLIEYKARSLDRPFSYVYEGEINLVAGMRVVINFNNREVVGYVIKVTPLTSTIEEAEHHLGFALKPIEAVLDLEPIMQEELMELAKLLSSYYYASEISVLQAMLPPSLRPKKSALRAPKISYEQYVKVTNTDESDLTPKLIETLRFNVLNGPLLKKEAGPVYRVNKLVESGHLTLFQKEKMRYELPPYEVTSAPKLTNDQNKVINEFLNSDDQVYLLEGVTGSGKSEVYLALVEATIKQGKGVIMLVPEIALTPMMVSMFLSRYEQDVAVLHSELTPAERYDEYRRIARGECQIVVGVRSAIFAPVKNLGLIILDEEHVETYKQDREPFYHAREVAIMRAQVNNAKVILGSATPSLESRSRALKGVYHHLRLPKRINELELPETEIVNMLDASNFSSDSAIFSHQLLSELKATIARGEQAILLINRRGYATYVNCRKCNHVFTCPDDHNVLTYHYQDNMLKCHYCDHVELFPTVCPKCGSTALWKTGYGTERVEKEVQRLLPNARTLRLDSDSAKVRQTIAKTIEKFRKHEADILIGTQMIAKGHDFPLVTLVGVVLADMGLNYPSYRSSERTFELLTQAIGRSGRSDLPGKAIIQTNMPEHYVIELAAKQDYEQFFAKEMRMRRLLNFVPYTFLIKVTLEGKDEKIVERTISVLSEDLKSKLTNDAEIIGPAIPFLDYKRGLYSRYLVIKYKNYFKIKPRLLEAFRPLISNNEIVIKIDVDSVDV